MTNFIHACSFTNCRNCEVCNCGKRLRAEKLNGETLLIFSGPTGNRVVNQTRHYSVRRIIHSYYTIFAVRVVDKYLIFQCRRGGQPIGLWKLNIRAEKTNRHLDIINIFKYRTRSWETILLISKTPSVLSNRRWTNTTGNWQCQSRRSHVSSLRIAELEVHNDLENEERVFISISLEQLISREDKKVKWWKGFPQWETWNKLVSLSQFHQLSFHSMVWKIKII